MENSCAVLGPERLSAAIKKLTLLNDRFFKRCLKGQKAALSRIFSVILDEPVVIERAETEETLPNLLNRGVRLDATGTDALGHLFNLEVQTDSRGAEVGRALYNAAMLCAAKAEPGAAFGDLPNVDVVFAVVADMSGVFGADLPIYHFDLKVRETGQAVKTWLRIVYVNAGPKFRDPSTPVGQLMCDFAQDDPDSMFFPEISGCVRPYKQRLLEGEDKEMIDFIRTEFATELSEGRMEGRMEGRVEGRVEGQTLAAINMLALGDPVERVAKCVELPLAEVVRLKEQQAKGQPIF